jgi:hypothetical protein
MTRAGLISKPHGLITKMCGSPRRSDLGFLGPRSWDRAKVIGGGLLAPRASYWAFTVSRLATEPVQFMLNRRDYLNNVVSNPLPAVDDRGCR